MPEAKDPITQALLRLLNSEESKEIQHYEGEEGDDLRSNFPLDVDMAIGLPIAKVRAIICALLLTEFEVTVVHAKYAHPIMPNSSTKNDIPSQSSIIYSSERRATTRGSGAKTLTSPRLITRQPDAGWRLREF